MLNIIKDYVNNDDQCIKKTAVSQYKFLHQVNLVLAIFWNTFNSQFYQQTDGVSMVWPTSSATAEIYVLGHEQNGISMVLHSGILFLSVGTWKIFSIASTTCKNTFKWRKKVMEN